MTDHDEERVTGTRGERERRMKDKRRERTEGGEATDYGGERIKEVKSLERRQSKKTRERNIVVILVPPDI